MKTVLLLLFPVLLLAQWQPTDMAELKCWLKNDAAQITNTSNAVESWADLSGLANNFGQTNADFRPAYNGITIDFDGTNDDLEITSDSDFDIGATANVSIAMLFKVDFSSGLLYMYCRRAASTNIVYIAYNATANSFQWNLGDNTTQLGDTPSQDAEDGAYHTIVMTINRATTDLLKVYFDGVQIGTSFDISTIANAVAPAVAPTLGSRNGSSFWNGEILDFVFVAKEMSVTEIQDYNTNSKAGWPILSDQDKGFKKLNQKLKLNGLLK